MWAPKLCASIYTANHRTPHRTAPESSSNTSAAQVTEKQRSALRRVVAATLDELDDLAKGMVLREVERIVDSVVFRH